MKQASLQKLRDYIGTHVRVVQRHVTNTSVLEGTLMKVEANGIYIQEHEPKTAPIAPMSGFSDMIIMYDSGRRYINKSHLIQVTVESGERIE